MITFPVYFVSWNNYLLINAQCSILGDDKLCESVSSSIASKPKERSNIEMVIVCSFVGVTTQVDLRT